MLFCETRIDNGAKVNGATQASSISHWKETEHTNYQNSFEPARKTAQDHATRTFRDREDFRGDTLGPVQNRRVEWNHGQTKRFQAFRSSPFTANKGYHTSVENQAHRVHLQSQDSRSSQRAATYPTTRDWESVEWLGHRPSLATGHVTFGTEPAPSDSYNFTSCYLSTHGHGGYGTPFDRSSASSEHRRALQGNHEKKFSSSYSRVSPPLRYFESRPHQWETDWYGQHATHSQISSNESASTRGMATNWYGQHATHSRNSSNERASTRMGMETDWYSQHSTHSRNSSNESASTKLGMVPIETSQPVRRWSVHGHHDTTGNIADAVRANNHESFTSSREWHEDDAMKASTPIVLTTSGLSDNSSCELGWPTNDHQDRTDDASRSSNETAQTFSHRPMISKESVTFDEPAPAKRMKPAYDHLLDGNPSSLELLCSATLNLGPLQQNTAGCSCPRSNCIKLYCDCFKAGRRCSSECSCSNCKNTAAESGFDGERTRAIKNILARNPRAFTGGKKEMAPRNPGDLVCNCVKSRCLKLYCDCFHKGKLCTEACLCVSCLNTQEESHVGGRRKMAIQNALEKRADAFTRAPKEVGSGCACKNNR